jgi:ectoine hydroxylase-related dioxygenase (phytanoyl-CoA dioxygenase family)
LSLGSRLLRNRNQRAVPVLVGHTAFLKPALVGRSVALHQDQYLWRHQWLGALTLWISLDRCDEHNGALLLCPGSHHLGLVVHTQHARTTGAAIAVADNAIVEPKVLCTDAGDIVIWDRHTIHGSGVNRSTSQRRAMALVFADASQEHFTADDIFYPDDPGMNASSRTLDI